MHDVAASSESSVWFAPCPRGLAPLLAAELEQIGARDGQTQRAGVGFTGSLEQRWGQLERALVEI